MKSKKAFSSEQYIVGLLVLLILLAVFGYILYITKVNISEGSIREIRQQNVKKNAQAHILGVDVSSELSFPIIRMDIKKGEEMEKASDALVHDWQDLLKGQEEIFETKTTEKVYCVPGHYLTFKDKKKISAVELAEYQRTHNIDVIGEKNIPISEYLTGYTTDKSVFEQETEELKSELGNKEGVLIVNDGQIPDTEELKEKYAINTNYDYQTVFVYMKKGYWTKWLNSVFGTGIGMTGGFITGIVLVPITWGGSLVISAISIGGGITGGIIGYKTGSSKSADWDAGIFLVPNKAEVLKDLKCDILPAKSG